MKKLSAIETLWYYLSVILSLGFWFTIKVVIKKAMIESNAQQI